MLRFIATALHDVLRKVPSEAVLLDNYARMCIVLSEIINEVRLASFGTEVKVTPGFRMSDLLRTLGAHALD
jgi:hypothetical protein